MGKYIVRYGLGGGIGGADSEKIIDAPDLDQANLIAYEMACELMNKKSLKSQLKFWDSMIERLENVNHQPTKISLGRLYRAKREKVAMQIGRKVK